MSEDFASRLWVVRKRVLILGAALLACALVLVALGRYASKAQGDPGAIVYLIPILIAAIVGLALTTLFMRERWAKSLEVTHCPKCGQFIWGNIAATFTVAISPSCPSCFKRLEDATK